PFITLSFPAGKSYNSYPSAEQRPFRISLALTSPADLIIDKPAEINLNFSAYFQKYNISRPFDENSLRVYETDSTGRFLDSSIIFQFDRAPGYDSLKNAAGTLIFIVKGETRPGIHRFYLVYFDTAGRAYNSPEQGRELYIEDNIAYRGEKSFKITTPYSIYYFHKTGAGFAGMLDREGKDWIDFNADSSDKKYRGIPNMGSCAHPGYPLPADTSTLGSISSIVSGGPLKIRIHSVTTDNKWEFNWDFFPGFARMELTRAGGKYWFLYEGVPNGNMNLESGYSVRNNHLRKSLNTEWKTGILTSPKWVFFGDLRTNRVLYLAMHGQDNHNDFYRPYRTYDYPNNMTVFGFGRQDPVQPDGKLLDQVPALFSVGIYEDTSYSAVQKIILSNMSTLSFSCTYDSPAVQLPSVPVLVLPADNQSGLPSSVRFVWKPSTRADSYDLQLSDKSDFSSLLFQRSAIRDTVIIVDSLPDGQRLYCKIRSANTSGFSSYSVPISFITLLKPPADLTAKLIIPDNIELSWRSDSHSAKGFIVERQSGTDEYQTIDSAGMKTFSFLDTTAQPGILYKYRVKSFNEAAVSLYSNEIRFSYITSVSDASSSDYTYSLQQNHPNPFNNRTVISYSLRDQSYVKLKIYDLTGREVASLVEKFQNPGSYTILFDASALPSGLYLYIINAGSFIAVKKLLILK
ncbi:MAG: T9SS type A sorting domain-containing protein, partial [Syntrophothermus sp.]